MRNEEEIKERHRKVIWLKRYRIAELEVERCEAALAMWRQRSERITQQPTYFKYVNKYEKVKDKSGKVLKDDDGTDMERISKEFSSMDKYQRKHNEMAPVIIRGGNALKLEDIIAAIDQCEHQITESIFVSASIRNEITNAIAMLPERMDRLILSYIYISGYSFYETGEKLGRGYETIRKHHKKAVDLINI